MNITNYNNAVEETSRLSLLPKNFADVLNGWIEGNQPTELMIEQLAPNQAPSNDGDDDDDIEKSAHLWQLKYRASQDGWSGDKWLELCENKGPSITLVRRGFKQGRTVVLLPAPGPAAPGLFRPRSLNSLDNSV
jgi:hypothetical protein